MLMLLSCWGCWAFLHSTMG